MIIKKQGSYYGPIPCETSGRTDQTRYFESTINRVFSYNGIFLADHVYPGPYDHHPRIQRPK